MVRPAGSPKSRKRRGAKKVTAHRPTKEQQEAKTKVKRVPPHK